MGSEPGVGTIRVNFAGVAEALGDLLRLGAEMDARAAASRVGVVTQSKGATAAQAREVHRELQEATVQMERLVRQTIKVLINARELFAEADAGAGLVFKEGTVSLSGALYNEGTRRYAQRNFPSRFSAEQMR
jgi:hypothetical protein